MKKSELKAYIKESIFSTLNENYIGDKKLSDLPKMGTADMNMWHVVKLIDAGVIKDSDYKKALKALDPSRPLDENEEIPSKKELSTLEEAPIKEPIKLKDALERYSFGEILDTAAEHYEEDGEKDMALLARQTAAKFRKMLDDFDGGIREDEVAVAGMDDDDDKDAIKQAKAARGKNKKYDIVLNDLKRVETEMKSLARDYSKADGVEKDNILKKLKDLTNRKNELKQQVEKYADKLV